MKKDKFAVLSERKKIITKKMKDLKFELQKLKASIKGVTVTVPLRNDLLIQIRNTNLKIGRAKLRLVNLNEQLLGLDIPPAVQEALLPSISNFEEGLFKNTLIVNLGNDKFFTVEHDDISSKIVFDNRFRLTNDDMDIVDAHWNNVTGLLKEFDVERRASEAFCLAKKKEIDWDLKLSEGQVVHLVFDRGLSVNDDDAQMLRDYVEKLISVK